MSTKKKPETTAQAPAGQEEKPEGNTAGTAADTQPDAAPADDAHAPADNDPPAGQEEETSPDPQPDPEAAEPEETPPAEQAEESPAENAELAQVKAALLAANCEIAAYKALTAYAPDTVVQVSDGTGVKLEYQRDVNIAITHLEDAIASMTTT